MRGGPRFKIRRARRVQIFAPFQVLGASIDFQCMPSNLSPGFHGGDR